MVWKVGLHTVGTNELREYGFGFFVESVYELCMLLKYVSVCQISVGIV